MTNLQTAIEALERIAVLKVVEAGDGETLASSIILNRIMNVADTALTALRAMEGQTAPQTASPIPTDFVELAGEWSVREGFGTWYAEHGAVVRNLCRWLTARLKGATHE